MAYPYPPHDPRLPYIGREHYFLTFCTVLRSVVFTGTEVVALVLAQFLRAAAEHGFEITAYCFMPDHVHLLVKGLADDSDSRAFIKAAKQYSGYYYKQMHRQRLWQRYGFERTIRDDRERAFVIGYIMTNPVRSGLVTHPADYPYVGSQRYTVAEMEEVCEYRSAV